MIGIDITNTMLHAVGGRASENGITVNAYASAPLPVFIKSDGSSDKRSVADAVKQMLGPEFKGQQVTVLFSESEVVSHQYEFPYDKYTVQLCTI
jgi:Tfp pilus assembly PilM family ATPase